jgi:hypothetical protein
MSPTTSSLKAGLVIPTPMLLATILHALMLLVLICINVELLKDALLAVMLLALKLLVEMTDDVILLADKLLLTRLLDILVVVAASTILQFVAADKVMLLSHVYPLI